jgi:hypothetical protein
VFDQIQCYFTVKNREGHSTSTALTEITDDWLREIDNKNILGAVLLDFISAFDIIHQSLLEKMCYGFTPPVIIWIKSYLSNRTQRVFFNDGLQHNPCRNRFSPAV